MKPPELCVARHKFLYCREGSGYFTEWVFIVQVELYKRGREFALWPAPQKLIHLLCFNGAGQPLLEQTFLGEKGDAGCQQKDAKEYYKLKRLE